MALRHGSMSAVNQYLVLEYVRDNPNTTRTAISKALSVSPATVSRMISELLRQGILLETESGNVPDSPGRPSTVLNINLSVESVVGIDLGGTKCHGALANVRGEVLSEAVITVEEAGSAFSALLRVWEILKADAAKRQLNVSALAIGIPAVIDPDTDLAWRGPNVGWEGFDLIKRVGEFGVPFVVDNDVNLAALAEGSVGKAKGIKDYALISIGTGLGGAIVADGRLIRGRHQAGGEISTMVGGLEQVNEARVSTTGGLETLLSGVAIAARAAAIVTENPAAAQELGTEPTAKDVITSGLNGGHYGRVILEEIVTALAFAIINVSAVTDPELVIIDGSVGRALAPLFDQVIELVALHNASPPKLDDSELGPNSTVAGAIAGAIQHLRQQGAPNILGSLTAEGAGR